MGIAGLTQYINKYMPNIFVTCDLVDCVVDGNALTYFISKSVSFVNGQQYKQLEFFTVQMLQLIPKDSVYVFDGALPKFKQKTRYERNCEKASRLKQLVTLSIEKSEDQYAKILSQSLLPPFSIDVVFKTLSKYGRRCIYAHEEADLLIASMAKTMNRPVLSMDSDFYVFDLQDGYIPLNTISAGGKARKYNRKNFCNAAGISKDHLHILAVLAGNDVLSKEEMDNLYRTNPGLCLKQHIEHTSKRIKAVIKLCSSLGKLSRIDAQKAITKKLSKDWIPKLEYAFDLAYDQYSNNLVPTSDLSSGLMRLERGDLNPKVLEIIILDIFYCNPFFPSNYEKNVWHRSKVIRQHCYEILGVDSVLEHYRFNSIIEETLVSKISQDQQSYNSDILELMTQELAKNCDSIEDTIVVIMRYLILEYAMTGQLICNHEVSSCICSFLVSMEIEPSATHPLSKKDFQPTASTLDLMGSLETIMFCFTILRQIENKQDLELFKLLDGISFLHLFGRIRRGVLPQVALGSSGSNAEKFKDLYQRSIAGFDQYIDIVFDY
jgi:XPG domain containing